MTVKLGLLNYIACATFVASARLGADAPPEPVPVTGKIQWTYSYESGQKLARETGKPMLVVFRCER
jgi:hypothetical protein